MAKNLIFHSPKIRRITQTKKLSQTIWYIQQEVRIGNLSEDESTTQILQACKEAGLKFVPNEWHLKQDWEYNAFTPEFNRRDINSQIKEIEI